MKEERKNRVCGKIFMCPWSCSGEIMIMVLWTLHEKKRISAETICRNSPKRFFWWTKPISRPPPPSGVFLILGWHLSFFFTVPENWANRRKTFFLPFFVFCFCVKKNFSHAKKIACPILWSYQLLTCSIVSPVSWASCFFWSSDGYGCCKRKKRERHFFRLRLNLWRGEEGWM